MQAYQPLLTPIARAPTGKNSSSGIRSMGSLGQRGPIEAGVLLGGEIAEAIVSVGRFERSEVVHAAVDCGVIAAVAYRYAGERMRDR